MDGSSKIFTDAIISAGTEKQEALQRVFVVEENLKIKDDSSGSEIIIVPVSYTHLTLPTIYSV